MLCRKKDIRIFPQRTFTIKLSLDDTCSLWKEIGSADISISDLLQAFIEDIIHIPNDINDNPRLKRFIKTSTKKSFLQFLYERDIMELTVSNWEILLIMKKEIKDAKRRKIRYPKKEVDDIKKYIEYRQKDIDDLFKEYIQWSGEAGTLEEEMEHVVSWVEEMSSFNKHILLKKDCI